MLSPAYGGKLPPGVTDRRSFKAKWQGTIVTGPSGIQAWANRSLAQQTFMDLGSYTGRRVILKGPFRP